MNRRVVAEAVGTAMLLMAVVGSGIMGERLAAGNTAIALLANSVATGAGPGSPGTASPAGQAGRGREREGRGGHLLAGELLHLPGKPAGVVEVVS